jgi:hypothetical protein
VASDKGDYSPGSVVTITGDNSNGVGYVPGNTVNVSVSGPNGWTSSCSATVGTDGSWSCQVTLSSDPTVAVGTYSYTASSNNVDGSPIGETGTFTDAARTFSVSINNDGTAFLGAANAKTYTATPGYTSSCGPGTVSYTWDTTAGSATFSDNHAANPSVTFTSLGLVTLRVNASVSGSSCDNTTASDTQDVDVSSIVLTQTLNPASPIIYGQSTSISGTLVENDGSATVGLAGKTIAVTSNTGAGCTGTSTSIGNPATLGGGTTPPKGDWALASAYKPPSAGTRYIKAYFDGTGEARPSASDCDTLETSKASTTTTIDNAPFNQIGLGSNFIVNYSVKSGYGISGNTTVGTATLAKQTGPGNMCSSGSDNATDTLSQSQNNATDSTTGSSAGFLWQNQLSCTPDLEGTYTFRVEYAGDTNYNDSNSSTESIVVALTTVQVCKAAPAIAAAYLKINGVKLNVKGQENIVQLIAAEMADIRRAQFPTYSYVTGSKTNPTPGSLKGPCDAGYQSSVEAKTQYYIDTKRNP